VTLPAQATTQPVAVPLPEGTFERHRPSKPTNGIGERTAMMRGNTIIGERIYYPYGQLFEETFVDVNAPLPPRRAA